MRLEIQIGLLGLLKKWVVRWMMKFYKRTQFLICFDKKMLFIDFNNDEGNKNIMEIQTRKVDLKKKIDTNEVWCQKHQFKRHSKLDQC